MYTSVVTKELFLLWQNEMLKVVKGSICLIPRLSLVQFFSCGWGGGGGGWGEGGGGRGEEGKEP